MNNPVRVLVVDDHPVVRQGLRGMLSNFDEFDIVGEADSGTTALRELARLKPNVVLLDIRMPGQDGIQLARQMKRLSPDTRIIMLTIHDDPGYVSRSLEAGADGYLLKRAGPSEIANAIRAVHGGQLVVTQEVVGEVLHQFATLARDHLRDSTGLIDIEIRILNGIAQGATYLELAKQLSLSEVTVRRRIQDIYRKLNVADRAEAVATAIRMGLI